ncbi:MAG: hypothetical protein COB53_12630 [Elusimicrobia bacterium]|nr:MAG: hypothetical protein COB53_12630 [Elusimicrobiota bacterium]
MNKTAVALAADSAITINNRSGPKIYNSANKLFALSKYRPVGAMVYSSASLAGVPWETIIKIYRLDLGEKSFKTINEYAHDFLKYLDKSKNLFPARQQEIYASSVFGSVLKTITRDIESMVDKHFASGKTLKKSDVVKIITSSLSKEFKEWSNAPYCEGINKKFQNSIKKKYKKQFEKLIPQILEKLPLSAIHKKTLLEIAAMSLSRSLNAGSSSGVVIAGFGQNQIFPALHACTIRGVINDKLIFCNVDKNEVAFDNSSIIMPFAQREMVSMFVEGVEPEYNDFVSAYQNKILRDFPQLIVNQLSGHIPANAVNKLKKQLDKASGQILKKLNADLSGYRRTYHIGPLLDAVSVLPKDELAAMAESLVNLTSFKRRVSLEAETVGGPIDVAVISKGDGFIWISRKHYFDPKFNPQFVNNYTRNE